MAAPIACSSRARSSVLASLLLSAVGLPLAVAGSLLGPASTLHAGDPPLVIYTMNDRGLLSIGGTVLEKLKSKYDPSSTPAGFPEQQWVDLAIDGADRWALRVDGRIHKNGGKLHALPFEDTVEGATAWRRLAHSDALYALRSDGLLAQDATTDILYPAHFFTFFDLIAPAVSPFVDGPGVFALRTDGGVFGSTFPTPGMMLVGGPGVRGVPGVDGPPDGQFFDTTWTALAIDPTTDMVYGLRADGRVHAFDPADFDASSGVDPGEPDDPPIGEGGGPPVGPPMAEEIANFPFPDTVLFSVADLYTDIAFDTDGTWYVLRQDGAIFRSDNFDEPLVDLPGDGIDPNKVFVDFAVADGSFLALRFDGMLYGEAGTPLVNLQKKRYRSLALSHTGPDLTNFKNRKPAAVLYKTTLLENQAIMLPVIVNDVDKATDELDVQADVTGLPGATWDAVERTVTWAGGPAGKYSFTVTADDGLLKKPKTFRYKIKVVPQDVVPEKNRPPTPAKMKKILGLVGIESVIPVFAIDRDGDELTMTIDDQAGIFALGATYDEKTSTITWTPTFDDLGKQTGTVFVTDGIKTKKLKLKFNVVNPLIF